MSKTNIEWTDESWNPVVGCTRKSEGCRNCYAFALHDMRHEAYKNGKKVPEQYAKPFTQIQLMPERLGEPLKRRKPTKWFVNSVSDLFHEDVPFDFIDKVFAVMALCPRHTFQILTKRPERAAEYFAAITDVKWMAPGVAGHTIEKMNRQKMIMLSMHGTPFQKREDLTRYYRLGGEVEQGKRWPLPNVWIGTSVENQEQADKRIPELLEIPAAVRFLSCEPLLGPVDLHKAGWNGHNFDPDFMVEISWVIVGGESGPNARPMHPDWVRSIRDQCQAAGVPFFFKQWGEWGPAPWRIQMVNAGSHTEQEREEFRKHSEANGATHLFTDSDHIHKPTHKPWSLERVGVQHGAIRRWGKKAAGRLLDGREWNEFPAV